MQVLWYVCKTIFCKGVSVYPACGWLASKPELGGEMNCKPLIKLCKKDEAMHELCRKYVFAIHHHLHVVPPIHLQKSIWISYWPRSLECSVLTIECVHEIEANQNYM